jgi:hypothetical protein
MLRAVALVTMTAALLPGAAVAQEDAVPSVAKGTFVVEITPDGEPDVVDGVSVGSLSLDKRYEGDLVATAAGTMLAARTPKPNSAGYVAIERVTGTLDGKQGSFVLQHSGTMHDGGQHLSITIVPESGTGELAGIEGSLRIDIRDGKHFYELEYTLPR